MERAAYAKLNLALQVTGRTNNGYHTLDMILQEISLHDTVEVERARAIRVECGALGGEQNTAFRAARLFFETTGISGGADIRIQKRIPAQAGLGGGSSDAAAVLHCLNELYGAGLAAPALRRMAACIGADVPFFIEGGCARARGIGELLRPVPNRCGFHYLLVKPEEGVDTAAAYRNYHRFPPSNLDIDAVAAALAAGDRDAYFRHAGNALLHAGVALAPPVGEIIAACQDLGAEFAMMTGSGSCVFAVFGRQSLLDRAGAALQKKVPFVAAAEDVSSI